MKRILIPLSIVLLLAGCGKQPKLADMSAEVAAIELDADSSGGVDIDKGGTNAVTASAARTNLDVYSKSESDALSGDDDQTAIEVNITDSGSLITGTEVETALQENRTAINLNTAKETNATHTGDVAGATALTIGADKVIESHLKSVDEASDEECLTYEVTTGDFEWQACGTTAGDVVGPASSTDTALARFDGTTGVLLKDGSTTEDDSGNVSVAGTFTVADATNANKLVITNNTTITEAAEMALYPEGNVWKMNNNEVEDTIVGIAATQTLTNKTMDAGASNTFTSWPVELCVAASDETTDLTVADKKVTFRSPWAFTLTAVRCSVNTAPTGSATTVRIEEGGTTVLSTLLTIDATELTSTAPGTTPAVISDSAIADDAELTIDVTAIGSGSAAKGLKVCLYGTRSI